jgi:Glutamine phosphoribosylpyrophosphate amidotransferase
MAEATEMAEASSSVVSGLTHECGVFACVSTGTWPTQIDVAHTICMGLIALQHR